MPKVVLTSSQKGRFEHHIKTGMIETLHKKGLLNDLVFMEAVRIQDEKDKNFFVQDSD